MEIAAEAVDTAKPLKERVIIALDVASAAAARELVAELRGHVGAFKIGLQLFTAAGPGFVREVVEAGHKVFLDLKFHDIPNTVAGAAVEAARMGVWMFNVHASGGHEMMKAAADRMRKAASDEGMVIPKIIGVTVLTSSDQATLTETGVTNPVEEQVALLATLTENSGLDGIVASPYETSIVRRSVRSKEFMVVTPGIRPVSATNDDQKRVTTMAAAIAAGSDYVVIGRSVTQASDKKAAVESLIAGE